MSHQPLTVEQFLMANPPASLGGAGSLTALLSAIGLVGKTLARDLRIAGLLNMLGTTGETNVQGESVKKLDQIANETKQKRTAVKRTVQTFLQKVITELQAGNRLEFRDFGVFEPRERAPRVAQNPKTLERVPVPVKRTVKFKVGRLMRDALDGKVNGEELAAVGVNGTADDDD